MAEGEAEAKPKAAKKAGKGKKRKAPLNMGIALRVLYTLTEAPADKTAKLGRKTVYFSKYARKELAKTIKATPTDKKADALALKILKDMGGRRTYQMETVQSLIAATSKKGRVVPVNPADGSVRVPFIARWFEKRRGRKSVTVKYEAKKAIISLP